MIYHADHVGGVSLEAVAGVRLLRVAAAAQVHADEPARGTEEARRSVEGPVLGRDAVQQTTGSGPSPARPTARSTSPGTRSLFHKLLSWAGIIREGVRGAGGGNLPG